MMPMLLMKNFFSKKSFSIVRWLELETNNKPWSHSSKWQTTATYLRIPFGCIVNKTVVNIVMTGEYHIQQQKSLSLKLWMKMPLFNLLWILGLMMNSIINRLQTVDNSNAPTVEIKLHFLIVRIYLWLQRLQCSALIGQSKKR